MRPHRTAAAALLLPACATVPRMEPEHALVALDAAFTAWYVAAADAAEDEAAVRALDPTVARWEALTRAVRAALALRDAPGVQEALGAARAFLETLPEGDRP